MPAGDRADGWYIQIERSDGVVVGTSWVSQILNLAYQVQDKVTAR